MDGLTQFELTKEYLDRLREAINQEDIAFIKNSLDGVKPADITDTLHEFSAADSKYVIGLLEPEIGAEIIEDLDEDIRRKFLKSFSSDEISVFLSYMDSDDAVDILNEQPVKVREEAIAKLEEKYSQYDSTPILREPATILLLRPTAITTWCVNEFTPQETELIQADRCELSETHLEELVAAIEAVTIDDVRDAARAHLHPEASSLVAAGAVSKRDVARLLG